MMNRIWIDGCFDFAHHGHAGAMLQARQLGNELYVGVHSDEAILTNKGPSVMTLEERMIAVNGCRWCTVAVPDAPYVTDYKFMDAYGCYFVVHGDDITTDKDGNDCYQEVKDMGRFKVVKRTADISTTDLVGRMLNRSSDHHVKKMEDLLNSKNLEKYREYASGVDGKCPCVNVWSVTSGGKLELIVKGDHAVKKFIYIDGGFDLFNPGHILALKALHRLGEELECDVIVGVMADGVVNASKGGEYPVMNLFERSLCVLQSKYIDGMVLGAPERVTLEYLQGIGECLGVYRGVTGVREAEGGISGLIKRVPDVGWEDVNVESIVERVLKNREKYEERQRRKLAS